ncbi:MAG: adenosylcobinamide amidohydrolase [Anaerolineales bacterium]|nr:adenosylcobinamide amidohydrolase [Anaerolineales bacterium]
MTLVPLLPGVRLNRHPTALHVSSIAPLAVVSSAVVGGELAQTRHIINMGVHSDYQCGNHIAELHATAAVLGVTEPFVGLLTAARLDRAQVIVEQTEEAAVAVVLTLGISHPTAAGVTPAAAPLKARRPGTINTIIIADGCLPASARVNAVITATEAKTLALIEAGLRAPHGGPASGTGTDAIVIASTERGNRFEYAGPIATLGALIGRAVRRAVMQAMAERQQT